MLAVAIGVVLAPGLGAAISPMAIVADLILLTTKAGRSRALMFGLGVFAATLAFAMVVLIALLTVHVHTSETSAKIAAGVSLILGFLLIWFAVKQWHKRPRPGKQVASPQWMESLDSASGFKAFTLGVALSFMNAKNIPLTIATITAVVHLGAQLWVNIVAAVLFATLGSLGVFIPLIASIFGGTAFEEKLQETKEYLVAHNAVILAVVLLLLGAQTVGKAIGHLFG